MKDKELVQLAGRKPVTDSTFLVANASSLGFLPRPRFNAFPSCLLLCTAPATDSLLVLEVLFYTCPLSQLHCSANHLLWFFPFFFVASGPFRFCISLWNMKLSGSSNCAEEVAKGRGGGGIINRHLTFMHLLLNFPTFIMAFVVALGRKEICLDSFHLALHWAPLQLPHP